MNEVQKQLLENVFANIDFMKGELLTTDRPELVQDTINFYESYLSKVTIGDLQ